LPTEIDDDYNLLRSTFPPLSYLLNLEEQLVRKVLLESRLLKRNSRAKANGLVSPIYQLWEDYIRENGVDIEWSMCKIGGKARFFVRISVWSNDHPTITPQQIWRNASSIKIPKLHVEWLTQEFAAMVGEVSLNEVVDPLHESSLQALLSRKEKEHEEHSDNEQDEEEGSTEEQPCNIFDKDKFPLLHSLGFSKSTILDQLIQELVKFFSKHSISFMGANNHNIELFLLPSCQTRQRYEAELQKNQ